MDRQDVSSGFKTGICSKCVSVYLRIKDTIDEKS